MSATPFEVQEALRGRARERRVEIMDRSGVSHEEASVMAALDVAVVEIVGLTQRAEAAEAEIAELRASTGLRVVQNLRAECEALRQDNAMLSQTVQNQLQDLGLKGIGDHMSQYLLPDDECDECDALRKDAAAVAALREPSTSVLVAMQSADSHGDVTDAQCIEMLRAAIDAAVSAGAVQP